MIDSKGVHTALPKGLRTVASSEPHSALQFFLFLYAKKQEELAKYQDHYAELAKESKDMLESWDKQLISPMKVTETVPWIFTSIFTRFSFVVCADPYSRSRKQFEAQEAHETIFYHSSGTSSHIIDNSSSTSSGGRRKLPCDTHATTHFIRRSPQSDASHSCKAL